MSSYCYEAVDAGGLKTEGILDVADQNEALRRVKEMGLFPTKIAQARQRQRQYRKAVPARPFSLKNLLTLSISLTGGRVKTKVLAVFTRQLATLIEAGMPLLRGLRTLQEQEEHPVLKRIIGDTAESIESGNSLSEALEAHPKTFNGLYVNMVKAGELGGALEITLRRLAEFMEKSQRVKGKIKAAMVYPTVVLFVATGVLTLMMVFVVPRFQQVFEGLVGANSMPALTVAILKTSQLIKGHLVLLGSTLLGFAGVFAAILRTRWGRRMADRAKLTMPILGPVFRKAAISRFSRTLGTLLNSGVPILQALTIVKETSGNVIIANAITRVHESVKEGDTIALPLKASGVFPVMVAGMVDVGEQTGALPDMLMKIADNYDDEVDSAVSAMTSVLEPVMIVFLAVVVGGIVIGVFLPLKTLMEQGDYGSHGAEP